MAEEQGELRFRNPVKQAGYAIIFHVLTLDQELSDGAFRLYALLLKYARQSEGCWPGRKRLAQDLGKSQPTIDRRLAELVQRGLITREQRLNQTAVTWIEDLENAYGSVLIKNDKDVSIKDDKDMSLSKMIGKEETEEEADNGDGVQPTNQDTIIDVLTAYGVSKRVARRLAEERSLDDVQAWIAYAERVEGLRDPPAFVVAKLRDGDPAPVDRSPGSANDRRRYISGKYGHLIQH